MYEELEEAIKNNPQLLLDKLGLDFAKEKISCACFIHGGDNLTALNVNFDKGFWRCWSRRCDRTFQGTLIGFTRAVLSSQKLNWKSHGDRVYPFEKTLDFLRTLYDVNSKYINIEQENWCKQVLTKEIGGHRVICSRDNFIRSVDIPSKYFLNRGFSPEVLIEFDVGGCLHSDSYLGRRALVPTYDVEHREVLGISGRSEIEGISPKWKHTKEFPSSTTLYNIWRASPFIKKSREVIIVEGMGDIWRLWEAGVKNAVALYGGSLSSAKHFQLDQLGVMNIKLALDRDKAGSEFCKAIEKEYGRFYNIERLSLSAKDFGEMSVEEIRGIL